MLGDLAAEAGKTLEELREEFAKYIKDPCYYISNVFYVKRNRVQRDSHLLQLTLGFDARHAYTDVVTTLEACLQELSELLFALFPRRSLGLHISSPSLLQTPFMTPFASNRRFLVKSVLASLETVMNSTNALDLCELRCACEYLYAAFAAAPDLTFAFTLGPTVKEDLADIKKLTGVRSDGDLTTSDEDAVEEERDLSDRPSTSK